MGLSSLSRQKDMQSGKEKEEQSSRQGAQEGCLKGCRVSRHTKKVRVKFYGYLGKSPSRQKQECAKGAEACGADIGRKESGEVRSEPWENASPKMHPTS